MHTSKEAGGISYNIYTKYFKSKIIVFMLAAVAFYTSIFLWEIGYMLYVRSKMDRKEVPGDNTVLLDLLKKSENVFQQQKLIGTRSISRKIFAIFSRIADLIVILSFFSHGIREKIKRKLKKYRLLIKINCSHIKEVDVNLLVCTFFVLGCKSLLIEWSVSSNATALDLAVGFFALLFRSLVVVPFLIWMFSSVYNKTKWGLILSSYIAIVFLIFLANCTSILPEFDEEFEVVPHTLFKKSVQKEILRLNLKDRIFWDKSDQPENAALAKTGASRYIIIMGNLLKYGKKEFISFIVHEMGHADDHSTEKKLLVTVFGLGATCGGMILLLHVITPKYERRGTAKFSVLVFVMLANMYIFSNIINMFYNNLGILSEVNADIYAKSLGYGRSLGRGLYKITVDNDSPLFHSFLFTHYMQDHPSIDTRISYLNK